MMLPAGRAFGGGIGDAAFFKWRCAPSLPARCRDVVSVRRPAFYTGLREG